MNGYFAVQLDKQSCNVVKKLATKDILVSDHVTLAYKPIKKVYDKYSKLVGKKVGVFIKGYRAITLTHCGLIICLIKMVTKSKDMIKVLLISHCHIRQDINQVTLTLCLQTQK